MRYLLVTFIAYARQSDGSFLLDRLWAEDLKGLVQSFGPITLAAPEIDAAQLQAWGTGLTTLTTADNITFSPLPSRRGRIDPTYKPRLHRALRHAVDQADLVHCSNFFEPNTALYFAHDYATKRGKKTLFVVAEDFYDMLSWEWVRTAPNALQHLRRQRTLDRTDTAVRKRIGTASLTFLHTPAAVARYRLDAANAIAIRQPMHEAGDVITSDQLDARLAKAAAGTPLHLVTASRMNPIKGLDILLRAIALLRDRNIPIKLTLYGSGPQQEALQSLATRLDLNGVVAFPGALSPASVLREVLNQADLFAMPHLTSDFGRGFFDAIAAGLPVIAFRSPASQDTVRDNIDGLLASNADPEALAAAIARLHHDRSLLASLSQNARARALENTRTIWNALRTSWIKELFTE